jgi:hypothetical protein
MRRKLGFLHVEERPKDDFQQKTKGPPERTAAVQFSKTFAATPQAHGMAAAEQWQHFVSTPSEISGQARARRACARDVCRAAGYAAARQQEMGLDCGRRDLPGHRILKGVLRTDELILWHQRLGGEFRHVFLPAHGSGRGCAVAQTFVGGLLMCRLFRVLTRHGFNLLFFGRRERFVFGRRTPDNLVRAVLQVCFDPVVSPREQEHMESMHDAFGRDA